MEGIAPITAVCMREPSARRMLLALPKAAVPKALERLKHVLETALLRVIEPPIAAPNEFELEHRDAPTREQCPRALEHESVLSFRVHAEQVDRLPWPQLRGRKGVERRACDLPVEARPSASVESKAIGINTKVISAKSKVIRGTQKVHSGQQRQSEATKGTQRCPVALNLRWIEEEALGGLHSEASESNRALSSGPAAYLPVRSLAKLVVFETHEGRGAILGCSREIGHGQMPCMAWHREHAEQPPQRLRVHVHHLESMHLDGYMIALGWWRLLARIAQAAAILDSHPFGAAFEQLLVPRRTRARAGAA